VCPKKRIAAPICSVHRHRDENEPRQGSRTAADHDEVVAPAAGVSHVLPLAVGGGGRARRS
jgi:hypothetical protein